MAKKGVGFLLFVAALIGAFALGYMRHPATFESRSPHPLL